MTDRQRSTIERLLLRYAYTTTVVVTTLSGCSTASTLHTLVTLPPDSGWSKSLWSFDEGHGHAAKEQYSDRLDRVDYVFNKAYYKSNSDPYWQRDCVVRGCLLFDGYSTEINAPGLPAEITAQGFTISAWVSPHAFEWGDGGQYSAVVSQFNRDAQRGFVFGVFRHGSWGLKLGIGDQIVDFKVTERRLPPDAWSHIGATYSPTRGVGLYLNGQQVADVSMPRGRRLVLANRALRIGKHSNPHAIAGIFHFNTFHGLIDELRINLGARSAAQLHSEYERDVSDHDGGPPTVRRDMVWIPRQAFDGDRYRPQYHLLPHAHWMNEPHAPFFYNGRYHLFYQKNPHGPFWHQIHWGHWVSEDMVHWRELPIALRPEADDVAPDGIWSGSASYGVDGLPVLFFTAGHNGMYPSERTGLAVPANANDPDLVKWEKFPRPVTVQSKGQGVWGQFRDPFVWKDAKRHRWYQLVTSGIPSGSGTALLFWSDDLLNWTYHGPLHSTDIDEYPQVGTIWELPVFLPLGTGRDGDSRYIFAFNAAGRDAVREVYYWIGTFDYETLRFTADQEAPQIFDYGGDHFTGPSGFVDPQTGRSIMFSIAQGERTPQGEYMSGWAHNGGLPIHLSLDAHQMLRLKPIDELKSLRQRLLLSTSSVSVDEANRALEAIKGDDLEVELVMANDARDPKKAGLSFRRTPDAQEKIDLTYDPVAKRFEIDRRKHSLDPDMRGREIDGGPLDLGSAPVSLRLFLDRSMVEAYINERKSITSRAFPSRDDALGLRIIGAPQARVIRLRVWRLGGAYGAVAPVQPRGISIDPRRAWTSNLPNHDFGTCDLTGWTVTSGNAFSDRVVTSTDRFWRDIYFNPSFEIPGGCHLWGFYAWAGDAATGTMQTAPFVLGGDGQINFLIAGGHDPERIYIALVRAEDDEILLKSTGIDYEEYQREYWDASAWIGQRVYLKVVDHATGGFGHINLDDIHIPFADSASTPAPAQ